MCKFELNDFFAPQGIEFINFEILIFNRWGEEIYQTSNIGKPWMENSKAEKKFKGIFMYINMDERF